MAEANPSPNYLLEIPQQAKVQVYYLNPETKELSLWSGVYSECPYDTIGADWYFLDTVEEANFIIIMYANEK